MRGKSHKALANSSYRSTSNSLVTSVSQLASKKFPRHPTYLRTSSKSHPQMSMSISTSFDQVMMVPTPTFPCLLILLGRAIFCPIFALVAFLLGSLMTLTWSLMSHLTIGKVAEAEEDVLRVKQYLNQLFWIMMQTFLSFALLRWAIGQLDPTAAERKKAKEKAKAIMKKLGLKGVFLNDYETLIASNLVEPNSLGISWENIGGLHGIIQRMKTTVIYPILARQRGLRASRFVQPPKGVLLHGPPGCGKTLIAKAMAKEAGCWFVNLEVSSLKDKWHGESEKLVSAVFSLAHKLSPCVIFIDEIDSLLRARTLQDHELSSTMKTQFMALWDGLLSNPKKTVIVMGATNRPADLDPAILRRMSARFHIPLPDQEGRKAVLTLALKDETLGPDVDLDRLSTLTEGLSGSDLQEVVRTAVMNALAPIELSSGSEPTLPVTNGGQSQSWFNYLLDFFQNTDVPTQDAVEMTMRALTMEDFEKAAETLIQFKSHVNNRNNRDRGDARVDLNTVRDLLSSLNNRLMARDQDAQ